AGIGDGQVIRVRGSGNRESMQLPNGDLLVCVQLLPHKIFKLQGSDLICSADVSFAQLCVGTELTVKSIYGKELNIKIPPGTQPKQHFCLKGHGLPKRRGRGDMYVVVELLIPKGISSRAKKLLQELEEEIGKNTDND